MSPIEQLLTAVAARATALTPFVGQIDDHRAEAFCTAVVAELAGDDPHVGAEAAMSVLGLGLDVGDPAWWSTPLGRLCARHATTGRSISGPEAARMLGNAEGTVRTLVHRGTIARHPDGGIDETSVLRYLVGRRER